MAKRFVKVSEDAGDFSSGSSQVSDDEDDCCHRRNAIAAFKHFMWPFLVSTLGEIAFCWCMGAWDQACEEKGRQMPGNVSDRYHLRSTFWVVFFSFMLARIVLVLMWKFTGNMLSDGFYGGWFLFFSTFQWAIYLGAYYKLSEELLGMVWENQVMAKADHSNDNIENGILFKCLEVNGTMGCREILSRPIVCAEEFTQERCSGFSWIAVGDESVKCCVKAKYSLAHPTERLPRMPLRVSALFSTLQWMAVLTMKWVLELNPLMPSMSSDAFVAGASIDILDAILFAAYLVHNKVLYPKYGINYGTDAGAPALTDAGPYKAVLCTWAVSITLAMLAPVVYTLLKPSSKAATGGSVRTYSAALVDLTKSLRMLRKRESHRLVDEALELQLSQYVDEAGGHSQEHAVQVRPAGQSGDIALSSVIHAKIALGMLEDEHEVVTRPAMAEHLGGSSYAVRYLDGLEPRRETVDVGRLLPDDSASTHPLCGKGCIKGWCAGPQSAHDSFDNTAQVVDAFRSFFTLELPFFLWRFWFEAATLTADSWTVIVMAKNFIWGLYDLLVILSCGNTSATIFGQTPLAAMSNVIKGSAMSSVWVGPAGLFRIAADFAAASVRAELQKNQEVFEMHKAWLMVERERLAQNAKGRDAEELEVFDAAIDKMGIRIADLENKIAAAHT